MSKPEGEVPKRLARATALLHAGYCESAIDEARSVESEDYEYAAAVVVTAAVELMTGRRRSARWTAPELRRLVVDRIPPLLSARHEKFLLVASIGARVAPRRTGRSVRRELRSVDGMRPASASLVLWRAGAVARRARWPLLVVSMALFSLGMALVRLESFIQGGYLLLVAVWVLTGWLVALLTPAPMQLVADRLLRRYKTDVFRLADVHVEVAEPIAGADDWSRVGRDGAGLDESAGCAFDIVSVDGIVRLRRALAFGTFLMFYPVSFVIVLFPVAIIEELTAGRRLTAAALASFVICLVVASLALWTQRDRIAGRLARLLVPKSVPMGNNYSLRTLLESASLDGTAAYNTVAHAEGRRPIYDVVRSMYYGKAGSKKVAHAEGRRPRYRNVGRHATALYLRSFADDSPFEKKQMSTLHATMFAARGWIDLHVVPDPSAHEPPKGVVNHPIPDGAAWVEAVADLADRMDVVFVGLAPTGGLTTELNLLRLRGLVDRAALVVPHGRVIDWSDLGRFLAMLGVELDLSRPPSGRPLAVVPGGRTQVFVTRSPAPSFARTVTASEFAFRVVIERGSNPGSRPD